MAKNRYVNTHFWKDTYIVNLDPTEKLLFMYFLTTPAANISGVYEIPLKEVAFDTGIDKDMVMKMLERFSRDKKIYYKEGYIIIVNFHKHQNQGSNKVVTGIKNNIDSLPENIKKFIFEELKGIYTLSYLTITKPNLNLTKPNLIETDGSLNKKDQEQKTPALLNGGTDLCFNKFWKFYNRREGDQMKVREVFRSNILSDKDFDNLIKATRNYNDLTATRKLEYVMLPINFLDKYKDFIKIDN